MGNLEDTARCPRVIKRLRKLVKIQNSGRPGRKKTIAPRFQLRKSRKWCHLSIQGMHRIARVEPSMAKVEKSSGVDKE